MSDETRPEWDLKLPEKDARWFRDHNVDKITTSYKMTSEDEADLFVHFHSDGSRSEEKKTLTRTAHYLRAHETDLRFDPDGHRLISFSSYSKALERLAAIDRFEKRYKRERSEYKRLKEKFGDAA